VLREGVRRAVPNLPRSFFFFLSPTSFLFFLERKGKKWAFTKEKSNFKENKKYPQYATVA